MRMKDLVVLVLLSFVSLFATVGLVSADTHYVAQNGQTEIPPYTNGWGSAASNIQSAVNAAANGDTVLIGAGRYTVPTNAVVADNATNVVYLNKLLTLRSSNGVPDETIIDGEGLYRGVDLAYSTSDSINRFVLDGITVSNGYSSGSGGGIYIGSLGAWTGIVQNCVITHCAQAAGNGAGGMYIYNVGTKVDVIVLSNTVFRFNQNGGLYSRHTPVLAGVRIADCRFEHNIGFGVLFYGGDNTAENSVVKGNSNPGDLGAGVQVTSAGNGTRLRNCLVYNNFSGGTGSGGAVSVASGGYLELYNCTVVSNIHTVSWGGGLYSQNGNQMAVWNSIAYNNVRTTGDVKNYGGNSGTAGITMTNCCTIPAFIGIGNITNNPAFADFAGQDFRLTPKSPCVNAGTNQEWMIGAVDLIGNPRKDTQGPGIVDMGCYEFPLTQGAIFSIR